MPKLRRECSPGARPPRGEERFSWKLARASLFQLCDRQAARMVSGAPTPFSGSLSHFEMNQDCFLVSKCLFLDSKRLSESASPPSLAPERNGARPGPRLGRPFGPALGRPCRVNCRDLHEIQRPSHTGRQGRHCASPRARRATPRTRVPHPPLSASDSTAFEPRLTSTRRWGRRRCRRLRGRVPARAHTGGGVGSI